MLLIQLEQSFRGGTLSWVAAVTKKQWAFIRQGLSVNIREEFGKFDERWIELSEETLTILSKKPEDIAAFLRLFPSGYHGNVDLLGNFFNNYIDNDEWLDCTLNHWLALRECNWPKIEELAAKAVNLHEYPESSNLKKLASRKKELLALDTAPRKHKVDLIRIAKIMINTRQGNGSLQEAYMLWNQLSNALNVKWKKLPKDDKTLHQFLLLISQGETIFIGPPELLPKKEEIKPIWPSCAARIQHLINTRNQQKQLQEQLLKQQKEKEKETKELELQKETAKHRRIVLQGERQNFKHNWKSNSFPESSIFQTELQELVLGRKGGSTDAALKKIENQWNDGPLPKSYITLLDNLSAAKIEYLQRARTWEGPEGKIILQVGMEVEVNGESYTIRDILTNTRKVFLVAPQSRCYVEIKDITNIISPTN